MNSLDYLQNRLFHFQQKYFNRPKYVAFRMICSSIYALLIFDTFTYKSKLNKLWKKEKPSIVFYISGGLGDLIIATNYIYHIQQYAKDTPFKIKISYSSKRILNSFCSLLPGVELTTKLKNILACASIDLNRFPRIISGDLDYINKYSPKLGKLFDSWNTFFIHNRKFFTLMPQFDGLSNNYTELLESKRINQADIGGFLNVGEDYLAPIPYPSKSEEQKTLEKFGLKDKVFITINRGQSLTSNTKTNNKLWLVDYYNELIAKFKKYYGNKYIIVQVGAGKEGYNDSFESADLNLLGKTNLEELKVVLKHAKLHIDSEGGLCICAMPLKAGRVLLYSGLLRRKYMAIKKILICVLLPAQNLVNGLLMTGLRVALEEQTNIFV